MFSVEEIAAIGTAVTTGATSATGSAVATAGPAGDPISLIYTVQFVSVTSGVGGMPLAYKGMSNGFGIFNAEFEPPGRLMRQPCEGRKPCDESDPGFKGHGWTPDGYLTDEELQAKMVRYFICCA